MHDAGVTLGRFGRGQQGEGLLHGRHLAGFRLLPLSLPTLELTIQKALPAGQLTQADGVDVDPVQIGQDVRHRLADSLAGVAVGDGRLHVGHQGQDMALHEGHDVEGGAVDGVVGAEGQCWRHRHRSGRYR